MKDKKGFVYIMTNKTNRVLYVGVTSDLIKRVYEHRMALVECFTKRYRCHKLVYYEVIDSIEEAIRREKYIKGKRRSYKIALIEGMNPQWEDLYEGLVG